MTAPRPAEEISADLAFVSNAANLGQLAAWYDARDRLRGDVEPLLSRLAAVERERDELRANDARRHQILETNRRMREAAEARLAEYRQARETLRDAMRFGDGSHAIDGRWIVRRLDEVDPLADAPVPPQPEPSTNVWKSSGGRAIDREPDRVERHGCGCVTGWDDVHEQCFLRRCPLHSHPEPERCEHGQTEAHIICAHGGELSHCFRGGISCPGPVSPQSTEAER